MLDKESWFMGDEKQKREIKLDQKLLLEVLQTAYQKGEEALVHSPKELIEDMAFTIKSMKTK